MSELRNLLSLGQAAALTQAMPNRIRDAAIELGIEPELRLNMVAYYAEPDVAAIAHHLRAEKPAKAGA